MTQEEALTAVGKYGRVFNGYQYNCGQVVEVHPSGKYVKFDRFHKKQRWYASSDIELHDTQSNQPRNETT